MPHTAPPDALLFLHQTCPHCPTVLAALGELLKQGDIGRLEAVNIEIHPQRAEDLQVRSVPWCRIGPLVLEGLHSQAELKHWAEALRHEDGIREYIDQRLQQRGLAQVESLLAMEPAYFQALLPLIGDPATALQTRLGMAAILEHPENIAALRQLVPGMIALSQHEDPRIRTDACHYLGLSRERAALPALAVCFQDDNPDVRETAGDGLALLGQDGTAVTAAEIISFWFRAENKTRWFHSSPAFDREIEERFLAAWCLAAGGELDDWAENAQGALALVILLDQFPLNMFRNQAHSFSTEAAARRISEIALKNVWDQELNEAGKSFLYLPFMHSETLADQERSVMLYRRANLLDNLKWAQHHHEIIKRFGRFPHRNAILGRQSTAEEKAYLAENNPI